MPRLALTFWPVVAALVLRVVLNSESIGTNDAFLWERYATSILQNGLLATYENEPWFVHPPIIAKVFAAFQSFCWYGGARFSILMKLPGLVVDVLVVSMLVRRFAQHRWFVWLVALNPLALLICGYHGNTDTLCAGLCVLAAHYVERRRPVASALCAAAAVNVSLVAVLVAPVLLATWSGRDRSRALGAFALAVLPMLLVFAAVPSAIARNVGAYSLVMWPWGVQTITVATRVDHPDVASWMVDVAAPALRLALLFVAIGVAMVQRRRAWSVWQSCALVTSATLVLTPAFGVQFLVYPMSMLILASPRRGIAWAYVAGLFVASTYGFYWTQTRPLVSWFDGRMIGMGTQAAGLACWSMLVWFCVDALRDKASSAQRGEGVRPEAAPARLVEFRPRWASREFWERPGHLTWAWVTVFVLAVYVFVISAGTWIHWPMYMTYYDVLADGFRAGRLSSIVDPLPQLVAAKDPYSLANSHMWIWDFSLYDGKYYIYWGPLPALVQAVGKWLLGVARRVGDQYVAFLFFCAMSASGAVLLHRVAARLFPTVPRWLVVTAVLSFVFANPILHLLASAGVYQSAIAAGQALLLLGLVFAFDAVCEPNSPRATRALLCAGTAWAFALTCRVSLAPAVSLILLATAGLGTWWVGRDLRRFVASVVVQAAPVGVAVAALLLYNKLRFDEWLEFGTTYQLSTMKLRLSREYWPANLHAYWLRAPVFNCAFPYVHQLRDLGLAALPSWVTFRPGYMAHEPVVGLLYAVPCVWASPFVLGPAVRAGRALLGRARGVDAATRERARIVAWCAFSFVVISTVTGLTEMALFLATMRYLGDVTNGLMACAWLGLWSLYAIAARNRVGARVAGALCVVLASGTVAVGMLLGYQGYTFHFRKQNPALDARFVSALSVCDGAIPTPPGPPVAATATAVPTAHPRPPTRNAK